MNKKKPTFVQRFLDWWNPVRVFGFVVGALGISISVFGVVYTGQFAHDIVQAFYANVGTECMSIAVTIVVIDWLYERRDAKRERERLVREMRNPDNGIALMAVEELRAGGWLDSAALLSGKYLWDANLQDVRLPGVLMRRTFLNRANLQRANLDQADLEAAHLERANLCGAHLDKANLQSADMRLTDLTGARLMRANLKHAHLHGALLSGADLNEADLTGAQVTDKELSQADRLHGALMMDGSRYDGRYNLLGDVAAARGNAAGVDAAVMAAYYGIEVERYEQGQAWARSQPQSAPIS